MKGKLLSLLVLGILSLSLIAGFASAAISFSNQNPSTLSKTAGVHSFTIDATSTINETINFTAIPITDYNGKKIIINSINPVTYPFNASESKTLTINYTVESGFNFFGKPYEITLLAKNSSTGAEVGTTNIPFAQTEFYEGANDGDLSVSDISFNTLSGFGDDEDYWYPFDEVEVTFNVDNQGEWNVKNIEIQACLWDNTDGKCVFDEDDMKIDNDDFDLKSGKDQDVKMNFQVDIEKLTEGNNDYTLYIKAVGEIDDNDAPSDIDGDTTGDSDSNGIEVVTDDNFIILSNIEISESTSCGSEIQITADAWNVGDDGDEEGVYVIIYNKELGINKKVNLADIDSFDNAELNAVIQIPENAEEKTYPLTLSVHDEDGNMYENSNDDKSKYEFLLDVGGSCSATPKILVSATLESEAIAGKELIVKAIIKNTGSKNSTFNLGLSDYTEWASLVSIDKEILTLDAGDSEEVLITLNINKDISGDKNFNIVLTEGDKVLTQPVAVSIEKPSLFPNITGLISGFSGDNWYLWGIGALNVLLVLVIIIVAMKVAKKKE